MTIDTDLTTSILKSEYSIVEISRRSGVPKQTIFGWLNAAKIPSILNAAYVLDVLGYELKIVPKEDKR